MEYFTIEKNGQDTGRYEIDPCIGNNELSVISINRGGSYRDSMYKIMPNGEDVCLTVRGDVAVAWKKRSLSVYSWDR